MRLNSIFLGIFSRLICSDLFETNMDANAFMHYIWPAQIDSVGWKSYRIIVSIIASHWASKSSADAMVHKTYRHSFTADRPISGRIISHSKNSIIDFILHSEQPENKK